MIFLSSFFSFLNKKLDRNTPFLFMFVGSNEDNNKTTKDSPDEETMKLAVDTSLESVDEPNEGDKWFTINKE